MSQTLFMSFHRQDAAIAKRIALALREAGFTISALNPSQIHPTELKQELARRIESADGIVALISPNSVKSIRFGAETQYAARKQKPIFPIALAGTEIPAQFAADCYSPPALTDAAIADFVAQVQKRFSVSETDEAADPFDDLDDDEIRDDSRLLDKMPKRPRSISDSWPGWARNVAMLLLGLISFVVAYAATHTLLTHNLFSPAENKIELPTPVVLDGWQAHQTDAVSLAVPSTWIDGNNEEYVNAAIDELSRAGGDPQMIEVVREQFNQDSFDILLFNPVTGSSVNVAITRLSGRTTLAQLEPEVVAQYTGYGLEILQTEIVPLPVGEALKITAVNQMIPGVAMEQLQYIVIDDNRVYAVTLSKGSYETQDMDFIFETIIQSFRMR